AVRLRPERGQAAAEHLGRGAQLHVGLQADQRLIALHRLGERNQRLGACRHAPSPFALASSGWPQRSVKAASAAAATRYSRSSASAGAITCSPTGSPSSAASP